MLPVFLAEFLFHIGVLLIRTAVLVLGAQQSDSVAQIHIHTFSDCATIISFSFSSAFEMIFELNCDLSSSHALDI